MLKRIRIAGYKSFQDMDLSLEPLSVLIGPNGAGKSNLLDALQLLSRMATCRTLREAFESPYRGKPLESFTFSAGGVKELMEKESASFTIEADVVLSPAVVETVNASIMRMTSGKRDVKKSVAQDSNGNRRRTIALVDRRDLRYHLTIAIRPREGILQVEDEHVFALTQSGEPLKRGGVLLEKVGESLHLRREGRASRPTYYDCHLDKTVLSMGHFAPHYPHVVALREELARWLFFYFEPRERMRAANPVKEVRHVGLMGEELAAFLNTLRALDPRQFEAVAKAFKTIVPSVTGIDVRPNNLGEVDLNVMEGDVPISARLVSEGTLRVLGVLALSGAKEPPSLVGFEEPENGIHPRRISHIAEILKTMVLSGRSQVIATTHSPIFSDLIQEKSLFVCRKSQGRSSIEPLSDYGPLFKKVQIDKALDEESVLSVSERIMRGDFDA